MATSSPRHLLPPLSATIGGSPSRLNIPGRPRSPSSPCSRSCQPRTRVYTHAHTYTYTLTYMPTHTMRPCPRFRSPAELPALRSRPSRKSIRHRPGQQSTSNGSDLHPPRRAFGGPAAASSDTPTPIDPQSTPLRGKDRGRSVVGDGARSPCRAFPADGVLTFPPCAPTEPRRSSSRFRGFTSAVLGGSARALRLLHLSSHLRSSPYVCVRVCHSLERAMGVSIALDLFRSRAETPLDRARRSQLLARSLAIFLARRPCVSRLRSHGLSPTER